MLFWVIHVKKTRVTRPWSAAGLRTPARARLSQGQSVGAGLLPIALGTPSPSQTEEREVSSLLPQPASLQGTSDPNSSCWHFCSGCFRASLFVNAFLCSAIGISTACSQPVPAAPRWLRWQTRNKAWAPSRSSVGSGRDSKHPGGSSSLFQLPLLVRLHAQSSVAALQELSAESCLLKNTSKFLNHQQQAGYQQTARHWEKGSRNGWEASGIDLWGTN